MPSTLTTTPTCSKRSTSSRKDQFPARKSLPSSRARNSRRVAQTNLSTSLTIPMRTIAMGGFFGCHLSSRTPGGIGGGGSLSLNNSISSSRCCWSSGTSHAAAFRFASQSGSQQSTARNPENSYQIDSHGASSQLRGSFDEAQPLQFQFRNNNPPIRYLRRDSRMILHAEQLSGSGKVRDSLYARSASGRVGPFQASPPRAL